MIIRQMAVKLAPMAVIIALVSFGYGVAFTALLSGSGISTASTSSAYFYDHPFFLPWWALLGAHDVSALNERLGIEDSLLPVGLLWTYIFFTTILLLNLLIARLVGVHDGPEVVSLRRGIAGQFCPGRPDAKISRCRRYRLQCCGGFGGASAQSCLRGSAASSIPARQPPRASRSLGAQRSSSVSVCTKGEASRSQ